MRRCPGLFERLSPCGGRRARIHRHDFPRVGTSSHRLFGKPIERSFPRSPLNYPSFFLVMSRYILSSACSNNLRRRPCAFARLWDVVLEMLYPAADHVCFPASTMRSAPRDESVASRAPGIYRGTSAPLIPSYNFSAVCRCIMGGHSISSLWVV